MTRDKTERLLNLVICLLAARSYVSKDYIRRAVPGYPDGDEAFERMFERDKDELREMGVPVETGSNSAWFDDEVGYRVRRDAYVLPEVTFAPDEMAVLALAARAWQQATLASAASTALRKLQAYGVETDDVALAGIEPRVDASEASFPGLWAAVRDGRAVAFDYRRPEDTRSRRRHLEPWGVVSWHGRWYVVGLDTDRKAERVFRLSRIHGAVDLVGEPGSVTVPEGVDVRAAVATMVPRANTGSLTVRLRSGSGGWMRRAATAVTPDGDGWDLVEVPYGDAGLVADSLVSLADAAVVVAPDEVRVAVLRRLHAVLDRQGAAS